MRCGSNTRHCPCDWCTNQYLQKRTPALQTVLRAGQTFASTLPLSRGHGELCARTNLCLVTFWANATSPAATVHAPLTFLTCRLSAG